MQVRLFVTLLCLSIVAGAQSQPPDYACALKLPLVYGASISGGYSGFSDYAVSKIIENQNAHYHGGVRNPIEELQAQLLSTVSTLHFAEISGSKNQGSGFRQLKAILNSKKGREALQRASAIAALDAFYWPAIMGKCDEAIAGVEQVTELGRQIRKPIFLANVPNEDPQKMSLLVRRFWRPPSTECAARINSRMLELCRPEHQCYLLDMASHIALLNLQGVAFGGKTLLSHHMRRDGLHLTSVGVQYVAGLLHQALAANPPACAREELHVAPEVATRR